MSSLIYMLCDEYVAIATDSLAIEKGLGPLKYSSKIFMLPHLQTIVVGTGLMQFIIDWYSCIQTSVVVKDIIGLNKITEKQLPLIYSSYPESDLTSSTIYQFGYSYVRGKHIGFAYRSKNGFKSEELIESIGIKPNDNIDVEENMPKPDELIKDYMIRITSELKRIDDLKDENDKLGIGGNIYFSTLNKAEISVSEIFQFSDKEKQYAEMINKLENRKQEMI